MGTPMPGPWWGGWGSSRIPPPPQVCARQAHTPVQAGSLQGQGHGAELPLGQAGAWAGPRTHSLAKPRRTQLVRNVDPAWAGPGKAATPVAPARP